MNRVDGHIPGAIYDLVVIEKSNDTNGQTRHADKQDLGSTPSQGWAHPSQAVLIHAFPTRLFPVSLRERQEVKKPPGPLWGSQTNTTDFNKLKLMIPYGLFEGRKVRRQKIIYLVSSLKNESGPWLIHSPLDN